MPIRKAWLPREGFTVDVVGWLLRQTALDPYKTLPLFLLATYTARGRNIAESRPQELNVLKVLLALGIVGRLNAWISRRVLNNSVSDQYDWGKEIVVVTGGSDGIGKHVVLMLAERGIQVAVLDVQSPKYGMPAGVMFYECDISSPAAIADAASQVRTAMGEPTVLINNAGIATNQSTLYGSEAETRRLFDINSLAHYWMAREFVPSMVSKDHGTVVTVASQSAYLTLAGDVVYAATKAAAATFHEGLTSELAMRYNAPRVRTVLVTPGFTRTAMLNAVEPTDTWLCPLLTPETVAERLVQQVLSGSSGHINVPATAGCIAKNLRFLPLWVQNPLRNRLTLRLFRRKDGGK